MSMTEAAAAAIITAAVINDKPGGGHEPTWGDQTRGQRDLYTQLIISLTLGLSAFLSFCVRHAFHKLCM